MKCCNNTMNVFNADCEELKVLCYDVYCEHLGLGWLISVGCSLRRFSTEGIYILYALL